MSSPPPRSRRDLLSALALLGTGVGAGCIEMGGNVSDLSVYNSTEESVRISLEVSRSGDGTVVVDESFGLPAEENREFPHPFSRDGTKRLEITVDGSRTATAEWDETADADSSGLSVSVYDDEITANNVAA
jgi:hypothetical protein